MLDPHASERFFSLASVHKRLCTAVSEKNACREMKYLTYDSTTAANRRANEKRRALRNDPECDVTEKWICELKEATTHCKYCGVEMTGNPWPYGKTADHIVPIHFGGKDRKSNIQIICATCNKLKSDLTEEAFLNLFILRMAQRIEGR